MNKILKLSVIIMLLGSTIITAPARPLQVVTTFTIIQDIAQNIAGDKAVVESITKPGAEIHNYQPTPGDIVKIDAAELILWNGFNLETWFKRFYSKKDTPIVIVTNGITPLSIYEGPYKNHPNPHAWMSPKLALIYADNIRNALIARDPANKKTYQHNAELYKAKIKKLDQHFQRHFAAIPPEKRWLVSSEGAFSYLTENYGFRQAYLWPINADSQGTPRQIKKVIDLVKKYNIPVLFSESTISPKPAQQIAAETGARYGGVLYVDSLSGPNGPTPTFLDLLATTLDTIAKGFDQ